MAYEIGGRSGKSGDRYELMWVIYQITRILREEINFVVLEPIGEDEKGIDVLIGKKHGKFEYQQCKGRNGDKDQWSIYALNKNNIIKNFKYQLDRNNNYYATLVSPVSFNLLEDLMSRAKTNRSAHEFYHYQIESSSQKMQKFYNDFCKSMDLDPEKDVNQVMSYLKRMFLYTFPDNEAKNRIKERLDFLFVGDIEKIYSTFYEWVSSGIIYGKEINILEIKKFLKNKNIYLRNLRDDKRVFPAIELLNEQYGFSYKPIDSQMIDRKEKIKSERAIEENKSLIIHGKAGSGKTGLTLNLINYFKKENIPYLAINLEETNPKGVLDNWSKSIGLPDSVVRCLDSISQNKPAVLILDQLDTISNYEVSDKLLICREIIKNVDLINRSRKEKILIIVSCRSYDLDNHNYINELFTKEASEIKWEKIEVLPFSEQDTEKLLGSANDFLSKKSKRFLRYPSNLYIWKNLDLNNCFNEITTTKSLMDNWWNQIIEKANRKGIKIDELDQTKEQVVDLASKHKISQTFLGKNVKNQRVLNFLISSGYLVKQKSKIKFAHQSILDNLLAEKMYQKYSDGNSIEELLGGLEKQTPVIRYQFQIFMEDLLEQDPEMFVKLGQSLLEAENIRFSFKFVLFEILNQVKNLMDEDLVDIRRFVCDSVNDYIWSTYFIKNVVLKNKQYIILLRESGILKKWYEDTNKKHIVFDLLNFLSPNFSDEDAGFIKERILISDEDDKKFFSCISRDITNQSDKIFDLYLLLYPKQLSNLNYYLDLESLLKNNDLRAAKLIVFWFKNQEEIDLSNINISDEIIIQNPNEIINLLLPCLIKKDEYKVFFRKSLYDVCISILIQANKQLFSKEINTDDIYSVFMNYNSRYVDEVMFKSSLYMSSKWSEKIINHFIEKIVMFDNNEMIWVASKVLEKHAEFCSKKTYLKLEDRIIHYNSHVKKKRYKNQLKNSMFLWGNFQLELLKILPKNRISRKAEDLLSVLKRKFKNKPTYHDYSIIRSGVEKSPVDNKDLSNKSWLQIITNQKLRNRSSLNSKFDEENKIFISNSIIQFSDSFRTVVSNNPKEMTMLVLDNRDDILDEFIESWYLGLVQSPHLDSIEPKLLEKITLAYSYKNNSVISRAICDIIKKYEPYEWSYDICKMISDIALSTNEFDSQISGIELDSNSVEFLQFYAMNSNKAIAIRVISKIIYNKKDYLTVFEDTIDKLILEKSEVTRFYVLTLLPYYYKIDKEKVLYYIGNYYLYNPKFLYSNYMRVYMLDLYKNTDLRSNVINLINSAFNASDESLATKGAIIMLEMYLQNHAFSQTFEKCENFKNPQLKGILEIAALYFNKVSMHKKIESLIISLARKGYNVSTFISLTLKYSTLDLNRDKQFINQLLSFDISPSISIELIYHLEEKGFSLIDFSDFIFKMAETVSKYGNQNSIWYAQNEIFTLTMRLYDEAVAKSNDNGTFSTIRNNCLDVWDKMYEFQISIVQSLTKELQDR